MICPNCGRDAKDKRAHRNWDGKQYLPGFRCSPKAERSEVPKGCPPSATGSADARASDEADADSSGRSADVSGSAEAQQPKPEKRQWLRAVIMVEDTEANRKIASRMPEDLKGIANRYEGKKVVKCEQTSVFSLCYTQEEDQTKLKAADAPPCGERAGQPNDEFRRVT